MPDGASTAHLFVPKLATILGEGYRLDTFRRDAMAALTVAIVALPLSMAIATRPRRPDPMFPSEPPPRGRIDLAPSP